MGRFNTTPAETKSLPFTGIGVKIPLPIRDADVEIGAQLSSGQILSDLPLLDRPFDSSQPRSVLDGHLLQRFNVDKKGSKGDFAGSADRLLRRTVEGGIQLGFRVPPHLLHTYKTFFEAGPRDLRLEHVLLESLADRILGLGNADKVLQQGLVLPGDGYGAVEKCQVIVGPLYGTYDEPFAVEMFRLDRCCGMLRHSLLVRPLTRIRKHLTQPDLSTAHGRAVEIEITQRNIAHLQLERGVAERSCLRNSGLLRRRFEPQFTQCGIIRQRLLDQRFEAQFLGGQ